MAPWLHQLLGVPNAGIAVEVVVFGLVALLGLALLIRERRSGRAVRDNPLAWLLGAGAAAAGLVLAGRAAFGVLAFGQRGIWVPSYGVFTASGFVVALVLASLDARRGKRALDRDALLDLTFWILVGGLVGARLLGEVTEIPQTVDACMGADATRSACARALSPWTGSVVFYGGVMGALALSAIWCRRAGVAFWPAADQIAPFLALGHAIGRLGCIAAGCCYGAECGTDFALGIRYPEGSLAWAAQVAAGAEGMGSGTAARPVHPTAAYEALAELALAVSLLMLRRRRHAPGAIFGAWLLGYGLLRAALEAFRGDAVRGHLFEVRLPALADVLSLAPDTPFLLSTSQLVALVSMAAGVWLLVRRAPSR